MNNQQNDVLIEVARKVGGKPGEHEVLEPMGKNYFKKRE